jgi:hypothetical protein
MVEELSLQGLSLGASRFVFRTSPWNRHGNPSMCILQIQCPNAPEETAPNGQSGQFVMPTADDGAQPTEESLNDEKPTEPEETAGDSTAAGASEESGAIPAANAENNEDEPSPETTEKVRENIKSTIDRIRTS